MKFGLYLEQHLRPEWKEQYIDYKKLKDMIKALAEVETKAIDVQPGKSGAGERVTSLSMNPNKQVAGKFEGRDITEADFFTELEAQMKKVDTFTQTKIDSLRGKVDSIANQVPDNATAATLTQETKSALLADAKKYGDEYLKVEKYVNLNFLGFHKILKKHDKMLPIPCQRFYMTRLHGQRWIKHDYSKLFVLLSKIHGNLRGDAGGKDSGAAGQAFLRNTTKYWVRTEDISKVKHIVLQHLPVFQHDLDALTGDSQLTNSVYFDNTQMELYHGRLEKTPSAIAVRLRWYATEYPGKLVFVERKTHHDKWTGEMSVKERFTLTESQVMPFLKGEYTVEDKIAEMKAKGKTEADMAEVRRLFTEIYNQIDSKQLRPTMRTQYMRVAYQIPFDATVRISLDTNLKMIAENPQSGPDCLSENRWYRNPNIPLPPTEYTEFPHAILEVKLSLKEGQETPLWVRDLIESGLVTEVHKFSKFIHGCATLLPKQVQSVPYWVDDESIRPSMLRSQPLEKKRSSHHVNGVGNGGHRSPFQFGEKPMINLMPPKRSMSYGTMGNVNSEWNNGPVFGRSSTSLVGFFRWIFTCCGLLGESAQVKPRKIPMKIEPKVFFANERTLLSWMHMAITLGSISAVLLGFSGAGAGDKAAPSRGERGAHMVGMLLLPVAIMFIGYALVTFYWRGKQIHLRVNGAFHDPVGPVVLGAMLMLSLCSVFVIFLLEGVAIKL